MALVKCNECKKEISDKAVTCIHCGAPLAASLPARSGMQRWWSPMIKCPNCGYTGTPDNISWDMTGCFIALILLCFFVVPGVIYILWRDSTAAKKCCPKCKNRNVVEF